MQLKRHIRISTAILTASRLANAEAPNGTYRLGVTGASDVKVDGRQIVGCHSSMPAPTEGAQITVKKSPDGVFVDGVRWTVYSSSATETMATLGVSSSNVRAEIVFRRINEISRAIIVYYGVSGREKKPCADGLTLSGSYDPRVK